MSDLINVHLSSFESTIDQGFAKYRINYYSKKFDIIYTFCLGKRGYFIDKNKHYIIGNPFTWLHDFNDLDTNKVSHVKVTDWSIGGLIGLIFSIRLNKPLVFRCGGLWKYKIDSLSKFIKSTITKKTKQLVLKRSKRIIYNSKSIVNKKYLRKSTVVYNGVDTKFFKPKKIKSSKKLRILFVGRVCKEKGLDYLFRGVLPIKDKIKLTIIGKGELFNYYKNKYRFTSFLGQVSHKDILKNMQNHDIVILPSLTESTESFPNVLLEAMSCEKAVIGTNVYGIPEMIINNKDGLMIPEKNSKAITNTILMLQNKKLRDKLGKNARQTVLKRFEMNKQLEKLYKALFENVTKN